MEKENCHQAVVDPGQQRLGYLEVTDADFHIGAQQGVVIRSKRTVYCHHGSQGHNEQQYAAGVFLLEKLD